MNLRTENEFLFETTKDHPKLAKQEILSLFEVKRVLEDKLNINGNIFIIEGIKYNKNNKILNRLAYTNRVFEILIKAKSITFLKKEMKKYDWNKVYKESFAVDIDSKNNVKEFTGIIFDRIKKPKVNLSNPKTFIHITKFGKEYLICRLLWTNKKEFLKRKPHMKPAHHPTSLDPKLAIACINLCGVKNDDESVEKKRQSKRQVLTVLDPFCGSGGFLVEAGLMGFNAVGFDLDDDMLERSRINLNHYLNKNKVTFRLFNRDSTNITSYNIDFDAIVTDLPYGRASKLHEKSKLDLYTRFFNVLEKLKKQKTNLKILIIIPSDIDTQIFHKLKKGFSIKFKYSFYLHRTLSRIIYLIE